MSKKNEVIYGEIYSITTTTDPDKIPEGFMGPLTLAWIKITNDGELSGHKVTAQFTDFDIDPSGRRIVPEIGTKVEMITRRLKVVGDPDRGLLVSGYKFRLPVVE